MKKLLSCLLVICCLLTAAVAETDKIPFVGGLTSVDQLQQMCHVEINRETGDWTATTYQADAMLDWFWEDGGTKDGPVIFSVALEGNINTGLMQPVLRVYRMLEKKAQNVHTVSFLIGDMRYDFAVESTTEQSGKKTAEVMTASMTKDSLAFVDAVANAESVRVRLIGDKTTTVAIRNGTGTYRLRMGYASMTGMAQAKAMLQKAGMDAYDLWDLHADMLEGRKVFQCAAVTNAIGERTTTDAFGMLTPGATGKLAAEAQRLLIEAGFMAGSAESTMNDRATEAVLRAQRHYGLLETGCMDGALAALLVNGKAESAAADATTMEEIGGVVEATLNRAWTADEIRASRAEQSERSAMNKDCTLVIADGMVKNISDSQIRFVVEVRASLVYNAQVRYEASIVVETNGGTQLDTTMIAQDTARMIVYAEVPQTLADAPDAAWTFEMTAGGETVSFALE